MVVGATLVRVFKVVSVEVDVRTMVLVGVLLPPFLLDIEEVVEAEELAEELVVILELDTTALLAAREDEAIIVVPYGVALAEAVIAILLCGTIETPPEMMAGPGMT